MIRTSAAALGFCAAISAVATPAFGADSLAVVAPVTTNAADVTALVVAPVFQARAFRI